MRWPPLLVLVVALIALAPSSGAAAIELTEGRVAEAAVAEALAVYRFPVTFGETGNVYAKVLPTDGNAVHDGRASNGSVTEARGWRVAFAMERTDGAREELGTFADGAMSQLAAVTRDERATFEARVHVPADAAQHGDTQKVYVVLAFRPPTASGAGGSGGTMDEARALTLIVHLDPDALQPLPTDPTPPLDEGEPETPPVQPIDETPQESAGGETLIVVRSETLPAWVMAAIFLSLAAISVAIAAVAGLLYLVWRELRAARMAAAQAPERPQALAARTIPVQTAEEAPTAPEKES